LNLTPPCPYHRFSVLLLTRPEKKRFSSIPASFSVVYPVSRPLCRPVIDLVKRWNYPCCPLLRSCSEPVRSPIKFHFPKPFRQTVSSFRRASLWRTRFDTLFSVNCMFDPRHLPRRTPLFRQFQECKQVPLILSSSFIIGRDFFLFLELRPVPIS